jgi:beta-lactamase class A
MRTALILAFLIACGSSSKKPVEPVIPPPAPAPVEPAPAAPPKVTFPGAPDTVAGEHLAWILDAIVNKEGAITEAEVQRRMHASFLAQVPADKFVEITKSLIALKPVALTGVKGNELELAAQLSTSKGPLLALINVDGPTKQVAGLVFRPDVDALPKPKTFGEAVEMATQVAPQGQLLIAALDKGTCKPLYATKSKQALAVGSTFKLWVLLALADRVIAGKAKWEDELAVRDDWKSPPGPTTDDAAGTKHTLKTYADRMISVSDNTATDHLLYTLGRKAVETAMRSTKHASPARNVPLFATREMTVLKLNTPEEELDRYVKLPEAKRRAYLDTTLANKAPDLANAEGWKTARRIEQLEWFASPDDLCRTMGALWQRAQKDAAKPVLDVLSLKPLLDIDKTAFPYVGSKFGGEPGVLNMTWLVRRNDDKWFVVVVTANAPNATVEAPKVMALAKGVFELLAKP